MLLRRIYKQGNSWVLSIPTWMLDQQGIGPREKVGVESYPGQWITVQKYEQQKQEGGLTEK